MTATATPKTTNGEAAKASAQPQALPAQSTAMVAVNTDEDYRRALEPAGLGDGYKLAAIVTQSRMFGIATEGEALIRMGTGRSLGLSVWHALRLIYTVEGRPSLAASLKAALCLSSPLCEYFECSETTDERATYIAKRIGRPERSYTFTIADADRAGLVNRGKDPKENNWHKYRAHMLRARAAGALADMVFPDVTMGLETFEAASDESARLSGSPESPTPSPLPVTAPPVSVMRNFGAEVEAIKAAITAASNPAEQKAVRQRIEKFDGPAMHKTEIVAAYNERWAAKKPKAEAKPQPATAPTEPAPPEATESGEIDRGDNPDDY